MVSAKEVTMSGISGKVREVQIDCKDSGNDVPTAIVKFIKLTRESAEQKRSNAKLFEQSTGMVAETVEARAAGSRIFCQPMATRQQVTALKPQLADTKLALEKLAREMSWTIDDLRAQVVALEKSLSVEKTHVKRLELERATEAEKRQQLLAECLETVLAENLQLAKGEKSLQILQLEKAAATAKINE